MNEALSRYGCISLAVICLLLLGGPVTAAEFSGIFNNGNQNESLRLLLEQENAAVYGELSDGFTTLDLEGRQGGNRVTGEAMTEEGASLGFAARFLADGRLELRLFPLDSFGNPQPGVAETLVFMPATGSTAPQHDAPAAGQREVYINRIRLDDDIIDALEQQYRIPIQDGRYWYDANCGAWGLEDGPTAGFILAGLDLPGPMPRDISRGGTGIFINGREIHPLDQQALQRIFGQTIPGHYWLDAQGNLGPVGGAAIANLAAAIQQSSGQGGSVTHGYGQGGGARGTVAGGMYSGRTATGKSVFWYPGM